MSFIRLVTLKKLSIAVWVFDVFDFCELDRRIRASLSADMRFDMPFPGPSKHSSPKGVRTCKWSKG